MRRRSMSRKVISFAIPVFENTVWYTWKMSEWTCHGNENRHVFTSKNASQSINPRGVFWSIRETWISSAAELIWGPLILKMVNATLNKTWYPSLSSNDRYKQQCGDTTYKKRRSLTWKCNPIFWRWSVETKGDENDISQMWNKELVYLDRQYIDEAI